MGCKPMAILGDPSVRVLLPSYPGTLSQAALARAQPYALTVVLYVRVLKNGKIPPLSDSLVVLLRGVSLKGALELVNRNLKRGLVV